MRHFAASSNGMVVTLDSHTGLSFLLIWIEGDSELAKARYFFLLVFISIVYGIWNSARSIEVIVSTC